MNTQLQAIYLIIRREFFHVRTVNKEITSWTGERVIKFLRAKYKRNSPWRRSRQRHQEAARPRLEMRLFAVRCSLFAVRCCLVALCLLAFRDSGRRSYHKYFNLNRQRGADSNTYLTRGYSTRMAALWKFQ